MQDIDRDVHKIIAVHIELERTVGGRLDDTSTGGIERLVSAHVEILDRTDRLEDLHLLGGDVARGEGRPSFGRFGAVFDEQHLLLGLVFRIGAGKQRSEVSVFPDSQKHQVEGFLRKGFPKLGNHDRIGQTFIEKSIFVLITLQAFIDKIEAHPIPGVRVLSQNRPNRCTHASTSGQGDVHETFRFLLPDLLNFPLEQLKKFVPVGKSYNLHRIKILKKAGWG